MCTRGTVLEATAGPVLAVARREMWLLLTPQSGQNRSASRDSVREQPVDAAGVGVVDGVNDASKDGSYVCICVWKEAARGCS